MQVCVLLAAMLALTISASLLTSIGIPYAADGGSFAVKLHPAGIACLLGATLKALDSGSRFPAFIFATAQQPMLVSFMASLTVCLLLEDIMTGTGNLVVLLDTYMPAGLLAITLHDANRSERTQLRRVLQLGFAANVLLAVGEVTLHTHLLPATQEALAQGPHADDFRPCGLYDHPLTGAAMTAIGSFLMPQRSSGILLRYGYAMLMGAGLVAFGGRIAMVMTALFWLYSGVRSLWGAVLDRQISPRKLAIAVKVFIVVGVPCAAAFTIGLGQRLVTHLYWDPSAQVRVNQWRVLDLIDTQQAIFGVARQDLLALLEPLRLSQGVPVIENFWLLIFLNLGVFGFPFFVFGFGCLLIWCCRQAHGRALPVVLTTVAVASASNSLGRKSALLLVLVAAVSCMAELPTCGRVTRIRALGGMVA